MAVLLFVYVWKGNLMAIIEINGREYQTSGELPEVGQDMPDFCAVDGNFRDVNFSDFSGNTLVLNIFPSIDTPTCSASVKKFNEMAANLNQVTVMCISADLPFAQKRFCQSFSLDNVRLLSTFRGDLGKVLGVEIAEGPMQSLMSRAVVVVDSFGVVRHCQQVKDLLNTPVDYQQVWQVLSKQYK